MADPINDILSGLSSLFSGSSAPSGASQSADPTENMFRPTFAQRLNAVGQAFQGQSPGNLDQDATARNATYTALLSKGIDADTAKLAVSNPHVLQAMLPQLFGAKQAPQIVEFDGPYGQKQKKFWNPKANKYEDASTLFDAPAPVAPVAPAQAGPQMVAPVAPVTTAALGPVSMPGTQPSDDRAPPTLPNFSPGSPWGTPASASPSVPQSPPRLGIQQQAPAPAAIDYVVGTAVTKAPEGAVHKIAPDGSGFLYSRAGQPIFESKADADTRAKLAEKRADTQTEAQQQVEGVSAIINDARKLTKTPGFDKALTLGRLSFDVGIPTPWGTLGGDVMTLPKQVARAYDPENPAWSLGDDLKSIQNRLSLLVARPMMKGQGQVSDSERAMIANAIGGIGNATSPADFHFRLNSVQRMIDNMNMTGAKRTGEANIKPTTEEVRSLIDTRTNTFSQSGLDALAQKYGTSSSEMQQYVLGLVGRGG